MARICPVLAVLACLLTPFTGLAQTPVAPSQSASVEINPAEQLELLLNIARSSQQELMELRDALKKSTDEREQQRLRENMSALEIEVDQLLYTVEKVATGGADLELFGHREREAFDWRKELDNVFEPIVVELQRLTERPRKIERLRSEQAFYQQRLPIAEAAFLNIQEIKKDPLSPALRKEVARLEERWQRRRDELTNRLKLVTIELQETLEPRVQSGTGFTDALRGFLTGRGLHLMLAVAGFVVAYVLLRIAASLYNRTIMRHAKRRRTLTARVVNLLIHVVTVFIALLTAMAVLYSLGDWVLLGLLLLLLLGAAWGVKNSLPRYMQEARLLLNMGTVREGERVIYSGLPWRVTALNLFSTLHNPALRGGTVKLPVNEMANLISRQGADDEPWFPTEEGDIVLLGETMAKVVVQTPETVQLLIGGTLQSMPTAAFVDMHSRNLSRDGYWTATKFGIDYAHQQEATTTVRQQFAAHVEKGLRADPIGAHLMDFNVEFDSAGASSLDYLLMARFSGGAADKYFYTRRLMQRLAVEACNHHGWIIPFSQIVVHQPAPAK